MTDDSDTPRAGLARRDLIGLGGAVALAATFRGTAQAETGQLSKPPWLVPPQAKPGRVVVEKRGPVC